MDKHSDETSKVATTKPGKVRRVGATTAGVTLIVYGLLFIIDIFTGIIKYSVIGKLWPFILIGLGIEILFSLKDDTKYIYDRGAILSTLILTVFATFMGALNIAIHL